MIEDPSPDFRSLPTLSQHLSCNIDRSALPLPYDLLIRGERVPPTTSDALYKEVNVKTAKKMFCLLVITTISKTLFELMYQYNGILSFG